MQHSRISGLSMGDKWEAQPRCAGDAALICPCAGGPGDYTDALVPGLTPQGPRLTGAIFLPSPPLSVAFTRSSLCPGPVAPWPCPCRGADARPQDHEGEYASTSGLGTGHQRLQPGWDDPHDSHTSTTGCHFAARTPSPAFGGLHGTARCTALPCPCMQLPECCTPRPSVRLCHRQDRPLRPSRRRQAVVESTGLGQ